MKTVIHTALRIFRLLVNLYPEGFRTEFGDEMQGVFAARLTAAARQGRMALVAVCLHESRGLLVGLIREQVTTRRNGQHNMGRNRAGIFALACFGVALLLRRGLVSYFCNLANAQGGGIANRVACNLYLQDPGGWILMIIGAIALIPLLRLVWRDALRRNWNLRQVRRFALYSTLGALFGVIGQLSPRWMRWLPLPWAWVDLLYLVSIWLVPAVFVSLHEVSRERRSAAAALAAMALLLSATQVYTLCYAFLIAVGWGGPQLETLQIVGTGTANFDHFWAFLRWSVSDLMWRRGAIAIAGGALIGTMIGHLYLWLTSSRPSNPQPMEGI